MEIKKQQLEDSLELALTGRLDSLWADHVEASIAESIRDGHHHISLNMEAVDFVSSAGIRVLMKFHKQLAGIDGRLLVVNASSFVENVFDTMGLAKLFSTGTTETPSSDALTAESQRGAQETREQIETENAEYEIRRTPGSPPVRCAMHGDPSTVATSSYAEADCKALECPGGMFAIGLGTPGQDFSDCRERFGEFLAAAGAVAFLPTGQSNAPDYLASRGNFVPSLQALHFLACSGELGTAVSFQANSGCSVPLSELVEQCLAATQSDTAAIVMATETDGLVGASLRTSPVGAVAGGPTSLFEFPEVRDRLKFTPDHAFTDSVALVVGVASRAAAAALGPFLRPMDDESPIVGHFHAAAFTYQPLRKTETTLSETVGELFERERLQGVLHLINDTRPVNGVGQSLFVRGTCWTAAIDETS